jgi:creatinine amidohydrolase
MQLSELNWPQIQRLVPDTPVVIPIAALEQHGPHMPVFTDSLLLGEIVRRAEAALHDRVLFAPVMWLGNSEHHMDFAGTLSAAPRTYLDLLKDLAGNLLTHGFRTVVLLNGHGGNIVPAQQALFELRQQHRERDDLRLLSTTYWKLGPSPQEADDTLTQSEMGHACEWETSMMLALRPDLVGDYTSQPPVPQRRDYNPAQQAWITRERSHEGYIGHPAVASVVKGDALLDRFADDVIAFLERL